jgi:hypothetical protein
MAPDDDPEDPSRSDPEIEKLRRVAFYAALAQVVFWFLFAFYIHSNIPSDGDGMAWLAMYPATLILLALVVPALALSMSRRAVMVAVMLAAAGIGLNVMLFAYIAREFAR